MNTNTLLQMLRIKRPHGSRSERRWIGRHIDSIPGMQTDTYGNRYLAIGAHPSTLISCHTDTVHSTTGDQRIICVGDFVSLAPSESKPFAPTVTPTGKVRLRYNRECLGADDGAGCYAALRMIQANIPALYVFHRGEELGGLGSEYIAQRHPMFLDGINRAIAIDRKDTCDVITHQMMGRCCSQEFAWALSHELGGSYEPCPLGTFTDTANYTELVPECTNISAGYYREHTKFESLDVEHLEWLIDRLCTIDLDSLPTVRETWDTEDYRDSLSRASACVCPENGIRPECIVHGYQDVDFDTNANAESCIHNDGGALPEDWCYRHHMRDCWECESERYENFQSGALIRTTE